MLSPLRFFAEPSPKTHLTASMIFDLPHPLGPTTADISEGKGILVGSTKDLKPERLMCLSLIYLKKSLCILSNLLP